MAPATLTALDIRKTIALFERLAIEAGRLILQVREAGVDVARKGDDSPVTEADRGAEALILDGLRAAMADVPIIAEEAMAAGQQPRIGRRFLLVDPLDGTREFISDGDDFTVNIALIEDGVPTLGTVFAPAQGHLWSGSASKGATRRAVGAGPGGQVGPAEPVRCASRGSCCRIVASRSHRTAETDRFIAQFDGAEIVAVGSSLKFCLLADGRADLYPRFGRTMEWDTAAGDAVLRAAGGSTLRPDGSSFLYGKVDQANDADFANGPFIAAADAAWTHARR